jgi:hypothetical protein
MRPSTSLGYEVGEIVGIVGNQNENFSCRSMRTHCLTLACIDGLRTAELPSATVQPASSRRTWITG